MVIWSLDKKRSLEKCFASLVLMMLLHVFTSSAAVIALKELSNVCDGSDLAATDGIPFISPETLRGIWFRTCSQHNLNTEKFSARGNFVQSFLQ